MSPAASPCPDADSAGTPATPTAESQLAGIRELIRIAELQAQAYAEDAAAEDAETDAAPAAPETPAGPEAPPAPETEGTPPPAPAVPKQAAAADSESSAVTKPA